MLSRHSSSTLLIVDNPNLTAGIRGTKALHVSLHHTAIAYGSGTVEVFATPAMIALMEQTCMESVAEFLPEGNVTVGTVVNISHLRATAVGEAVFCTTELLEANGRELLFEVQANDSKGIIGKGTHKRFIVNKENFMNRLKQL